MRTAGLFAGIGGFELGLERAGHSAALFCEILPTARAVLNARFPSVPVVPDIARLRSLPKDIELLCAGFPCQDLSQAGRTAGLGGARSGLIGEVFRLLKRKRVRTVLLENVPFMLQLGGGAALREIVDTLEALRYRWAYRVVDSFGFGLPQRRERVYLVASKALDPRTVLFADDATLARPSTDIARCAHGFYWTEGLRGLGWAADAVPTLKAGSAIGIASPPAVLMPDGALVKPGIEAAERLQGFAAGWTAPADTASARSQRWGLVGNAVSVPVAEWLGRRILLPGDYDRARDRTFPLAGSLPRAAYFDGKRRRAVEIGSDPLGIAPPPLAAFVGSDVEPLSAKATHGFVSRTRRAKLRFPPGFIDAVEAHLVAMGGAVPPRADARQYELFAA